MRIGLFGGTFDPIHIAHLIIAESVRDQLQLDKLIFMPCAAPPHKTGNDISSAEHRLNMVRKAIRDNPVFEVSTVEIDRGGTSYTVDTLRTLSEIYQLHREQMFLIMGGDNLRDIGNWRRPDEIAKLCRIVVAERPDFRYNEEVPAYLRDLLHIKMPLLEISASDIRQRVRRAASIKYLVIPAVEDYINAFSLYRKPICK